jgi:hypothetical protein
MSSSNHKKLAEWLASIEKLTLIACIKLFVIASLGVVHVVGRFEPASVDRFIGKYRGCRGKTSGIFECEKFNCYKIDMTLIVIHKSLVQDIRRIVDEVKKFYPDHV